MTNGLTWELTESTQENTFMLYCYCSYIKSLLYFNTELELVLQIMYFIDECSVACQKDGNWLIAKISSMIGV